MVAAAHQSEVDFSAGVVAVVSPARTGFRDPLEGSLRSNANCECAATGRDSAGADGEREDGAFARAGRAVCGEIVSCDSVAVYRGMELGTAKPTKEERARVPHHLIDVAEPDEPFTAGEYSRRARAALREIAARRRLPIVTGGTGLYLRALTEGLFAGPARQESLRARLWSKAQKHGSAAWLHRLLRGWMRRRRSAFMRTIRRS
jgi:hypothetical protein